MHCLRWYEHAIILPYERNTHFKIADILTIPLVYLKGDILPNKDKECLDFRSESIRESNS